MIPRRALVSLRQRVTTTATSVTRNPSSSLNPSSIPSSISQNQRRLPLRFLFSCSSSPHFISPAIANRSFVNGGSMVRNLATRSMNDSSNRPPKETILLDGCDFEHWLVVMEPPDPNLTRDEIIDSYIKTLTQVVGSEDDARMKIYSVSTKHYFAFGALVSEELSYKIKELPRVRWVLPDSYLDVKNKSYGGEPFIDGQAVPYDPKYHEEWVRNNARANERSRRNDRPRNYDRSRRRENMMNRDIPPPPPPPLSSPSPISGQQMQNQAPPSGMPNQSMPPPAQNQDYMNNGMPMQNQEIQNRPPPFSVPNRDMPPPPNQGFVNRGMPPPPSPSSSMQNQGFQGNYGPPPPMQNQGFQNNYGPPPTIQNRDMPNSMGNQGYQNPNMPPPSQNLNYQSRQMPPPTQNQDFQNRGMPPQNQNWNYQGRDVPPPPMPNRDFQNRDVPPPVQNRDFPNRDMGTLPNRDYQSRDMNIGKPPGSNFHYREAPDNMHAGNLQNKDYQGWGGQGNMSTGGAPTRDHQSRDVPEGEYTNVANRNF